MGLADLWLGEDSCVREEIVSHCGEWCGSMLVGAG